MIINGKMTNPGELHTPITLQERTVSTDTGGFQTKAAATIASVMAKWTNAYGSEVWAVQMVEAVQAATVLIRYRSDVDNTCMVLRGSVVYEIVSLDNIQERNEYIELKVKMRAPG